MLIIDATPQTDALEDSLSVGQQVPAAMNAVQRMRELEREVAVLLAAMPANARRDPAWSDRIAHLLSRIVLFRVALADGADCGNAGSGFNQGR